jgi:RND family efflux transporter MFP subunit
VVIHWMSLISRRTRAPWILAAVAGLSLIACAGTSGQAAAEAGAGQVEDDSGRLDEKSGAGIPGGEQGSSEDGLQGIAATRSEPATAIFNFTSHLFVEQDVSVLTRRAGIVRAVRKDRGARVRKDEILCELEREGLELSLELARIEADKAQAAFSRAEKLSRDLAISEEDIESARFELSSAERVRDLAAHELEKSYVRAPFDGLISARNVKVGQVLAYDDPRVLFRVTAMQPLLVRIFAPQWAYPFLHEGGEVSIDPVAGSSHAVAGRIRWVNQVLDAASGSVEILAEAAGDQGGGLRPGMEVQVQMKISVEPGRLTLPREAVQLDETSATRGYVIVSTGSATARRSIRLGFIGDDRVEVLSGLDDGERILNQALRIRPGSH